MKALGSQGRGIRISILAAAATKTFAVAEGPDSLGVMHIVKSVRKRRFQRRAGVNAGLKKDKENTTLE